MRLLVTGGAGRLGAHIIKIFSDSGYCVKAFDLPQANWGQLENLNHVELFPGDITDPSVVSKACSDVDTIIHLAAILPPQSELNGELAMKVNVEGTRNLLKYIDEKTVFILASSISTYGVTCSEKPPLMEEYPQQGHNNYSLSKIEAEQLVLASGAPYVILRVAPIAVADLLELPDVVPYRADQRVEFIDVEDAAHAFYQASLRSETRMKTLNIAGGTSWQMTGSEFLDGFYGALGLEVEPNYSEEYTAVDWYDTRKSHFLDYQRTSFNDFQRKLGSVAEELGLI